MIKKAKIDLLDIDAEMENEKPPWDDDLGKVSPDLELEESDAWGKINPLTERLRRFIEKHRLLFIFGTLFLLLGFVGGVGWLFYVGPDKKLAHKKKNITRTLPLTKGASPLAAKASQENRAPSLLTKGGKGSELLGHLDHFVVDMRDQGGNLRLVFCDVFVETENLQLMIASEEKIRIRQSIHALLKRTPLEGNLLEARNRIRIELKEMLERLLGEKSVRNIYITNFEVM